MLFVHFAGEVLIPHIRQKLILTWPDLRAASENIQTAGNPCKGDDELECRSA